MSERLAVSIMRLPHGADLPLPSYATEGAAGLDLLAAIPASQPIVLERMKRALVPTGVAIALPQGFEAQVRPRSGLAAKHGVTVLNAPGTIDGDYRGEIKALLANFGDEPFVVERGMRIAQLVIAPIVQIAWNERDVLDETPRGSGGYGSTGIRLVQGA